VEEVEPTLEVWREVWKIGARYDLADPVPQLHRPHPVAAEGGELPLEVGDDFAPGQGITLRFMQNEISDAMIYK
jgi:hypothetical protein